MSHVRESSPATAAGPTASPWETSGQMPYLYAGLRGVARTMLRRFFAFQVSGLDQLPAGAFIVAANHVNYLDGVVLGAALSRQIVFLVMPRVYRATPLHPFLHDRIGSIPINLARPDHGAIRSVLRALEAGRGSSTPIGRVLAAAESPVYVHWSAT